MELFEHQQKTKDVLEAQNPDRESILQSIANVKVLGRGNNNPEVHSVIKAIEDGNKSPEEVQELIDRLKIKILHKNLRHKH